MAEGDSYDDLLGRYFEAAGMTPPTDEQRAARQLEGEALDRAERCGACGADLGPSAVVYRPTIGAPTTFGWATRVRVRCEACAPPALVAAAQLVEDVPRCPGCGRAVILWADGRARRRIVCSERCRGRAERGQLVRRPQPCAECGSSFTPARADARYCSSACRQRAHRARAGT